MRPTRRGWAVVLVVAASMWMAWEYGPRALNAVVTPLIVVLIAGAITVGRADCPEVRRMPVPEGSVGDRRTVALEIESSTTASATVRDTVAPAFTVLESESDAAGAATIGADGNPVAETTLESDATRRISYDVRLERRGEHRLGPAVVTVSDVFGLVYRRFTDDATATVLVYPRVRELRGDSGHGLRAIATATASRDRESFDHLREYQRGDSLRDVHWKSAAKRPDADLVVTEYAADEETGAVTIAADCAPGRADELATAVASVAVYLLEAGVDVGVALPDADRAPGSGPDHRREILAALARLEAGDVAESRRARADVVIRADEDGTRLVLDDRTIPFSRFLADRDRSTATDGGTDSVARIDRDRASESGETLESGESGVTP